MTHSYDVSNEVRKAPVNRYADAFYPFRQSSAIARSSPTMQIKSATHAKHAQLVMKITG